MAPWDRKQGIRLERTSPCLDLETCCHSGCWHTLLKNFLEPQESRFGFGILQFAPRHFETQSMLVVKSGGRDERRRYQGILGLNSEQNETGCCVLAFLKRSNLRLGLHGGQQ